MISGEVSEELYRNEMRACKLHWIKDGQYEPTRLWLVFFLSRKGGFSIDYSYIMTTPKLYRSFVFSSK